MFLSSKLKPKAASPILPVKTTRSPFLEVFFINGLSQRPSAVPDIIISLASLVSPPIKEGINIKNAGGTSATDITDGLASELYEMKREDIGFMIYEDKLNVSSEFKSLANEMNLDYLDLLFHVGEDFELVFTIDRKNLDKLDFNYQVIGEVTDSKKVEITLSDSTVKEITSRGYDHYVS